MPFDVQSLAAGNLIFQGLLLGLVSWAAYLAKRKRLIPHCTIVRIAVILQVVAIIFIMSPSLAGYIKNPPGLLLYTEILAHHTLGLLVIAIWVYVNLVMMRVLKTQRRLISVMRLAFLSWVASGLIGFHLYLTVYV